MTDEAPVLRGGLARCLRIAAGLDELTPFLQPVLPVADDDLSSLSAIQSIASIALLKRYEQLQDMLARLVRTTLIFNGTDVRALTRRDMANWMEKLGFVADADDWVDLSNLRNRLTHEYPINEVEQADRVNECWVAAPRLILIFRAVRDYLAKQGIIA